MAGRIVIDIGLPESSPETWADTEEMAFHCIGEALGEVGYQVRPLPGVGRVELELEETDSG